MMTSKHLTRMGVRHSVVVEPSELDAYRVAAQGLLVDLIPLDMSYKSKYDLCDSLGLSKSTGSGPARNFIWDHSIAGGFSHHWIMDDNINGFFRFNRNLKTPCRSPCLFDAMEDFTLRYQTLAMTGPNYFMFVERKKISPPFVMNTRLYSCNLIRNDVALRWRGRYNEDVILSLDMLKKGWCTIQFNAFLQHKEQTQTMNGGNSAEFYWKEGTLAKSQMLVDCHPDVAKVVFKFNRWHHYVDYGKFKANRLIRYPDAIIPAGVNNYGMTLQQATSLVQPVNGQEPSSYNPASAAPMSIAEGWA
jgi:hypothetical protein